MSLGAQLLSMELELRINHDSLRPRTHVPREPQISRGTLGQLPVRF
jgi:hypothetical protein